MPDEEEDAEEEYVSGPFCQHYSDPSGCDHLCTCKHECRRHDLNDGECEEPGCGCPKFEDQK